MYGPAAAVPLFWKSVKAAGPPHPWVLLAVQTVLQLDEVKFEPPFWIEFPHLVRRVSIITWLNAWRKWFTTLYRTLSSSVSIAILIAKHHALFVRHIIALVNNAPERASIWVIAGTMLELLHITIRTWLTYNSLCSSIWAVYQWELPVLPDVLSQLLNWFECTKAKRISLSCQNISSACSRA